MPIARADEAIPSSSRTVPSWLVADRLPVATMDRFGDWSNDRVEAGAIAAAGDDTSLFCHRNLG
jgi:hypothetical protein